MINAILSGIAGGSACYAAWRLGCIVPAINVVAEDDFVALRPPGVGVHFTRVDVDRSRPLRAQLRQMRDMAPEAAAVLAKAGVDAIAFACTSATFLADDGAAQARSRLADRAGVPTVTASEAVVQALRALDVARVAVATPYAGWVVEEERRFLERAGFEVTRINGLERTGGVDINTISPADIHALVTEVDSPRAQAVLVSCTDLPVLPLVAELEARHGKPVVTSNQATFWACACIVGARAVPGYGRLLSEHAPPAAAIHSPDLTQEVP